jgi:hypothetical protein
MQLTEYNLEKGIRAPRILFFLFFDFTLIERPFVAHKSYHMSDKRFDFER